MAMRIYTRTGDTGETGLFGGARVGKDDLRVEAYGTVDELNAMLGLAHTVRVDPELSVLLVAFQNDLFGLGADLATPPEDSGRHGRSTVERLRPELTAHLETLIDRYEDELAPLERFILPGGSLAAAHLHVCRTVCRRAERRCVALARAEHDADTFPLNPEIIRYLNRLSDLLFVLARVANHRAGVADVAWNG